MARRSGVAAMKVVVLTGPESTGKSWLAAGLQEHFGGLRVDEYVRWFIEQNRDTCLTTFPTSPVDSCNGKIRRGRSNRDC
jgi:nicotinamide riboside kinase